MGTLGVGRGKRAALRTRVVTWGDRRALEAEGTSGVQIPPSVWLFGRLQQSNEIRGDRLRENRQV
jgi:hypothetical protein